MFKVLNNFIYLFKISILFSSWEIFPFNPRNIQIDLILNTGSQNSILQK